MADLIDRDALESKIRENSMRIRFFDPSVNVILHLIRYAPAVNRWIPCSEKKPEIWQEVLVALNDKGYKSIHIGEMQEEGSWMIGGEFWYEKDDPRITHWMPLPNEPEVTKDDNG